MRARARRRQRIGGRNNGPTNEEGWSVSWAKPNKADLLAEVKETACREIMEELRGAFEPVL